MKKIKVWIVLVVLLCGYIGKAEYVCNGFTPQFTVSNTNPDVGESIILSYTGNICFNGTVCNTNQFIYNIPGSAVVTGLGIQTNTGQVQDVQVSWNNPGVYTVTLAVTANSTCSVNSASLQPITITVGSAEIPTLSQWGIFILFLGFIILTAVALKGGNIPIRT